MNQKWIAIAIGSAVCLAAVGQASDWPQFRGPNGTAQSSEKQLPAEWSADKNVQWKAKIPGLAWSSPIVWGDKVFVTTADAEKLQKPTGPFGGGGRGGPGRGGPGGGAPGAFRPPQPGQIMPAFLQDRLNLTAEQKKQVEELQKEVDDRLAKILTVDENKRLKETPPRFGRGGFGQVLPTPVQETLNLTAERKKQVEELQKEVDGQLAKILTAEQNKQLKEPLGFGRGGAPGQIVPAFLQARLNVSTEQKKHLEGLQKEVDGQLGKILTDEQNKQFRGRQTGFGRGGIGEIVPASLQDRLNVTAEQKKQLEELQKEVDSQLAKVFTAEQNKQLKEMRGSRAGPGGRGQPPDNVYRWEIYCLDRTDGKVLWKQTAIEQKPTIAKFPSNSYATETPVTDGERIYAYFGMVGVVCYDFTGQLLWKKTDLGAYRMMANFGTGSSPALEGGRLFIQCDNEEKSFVVALDTKTGKELWRVDRSEKSGWSTPLVWKNKVRTELVCAGGQRVQSYDPATGKLLWDLGGMGSRVHATPVADNELLYVGAAGGRGFDEELGGAASGAGMSSGRPLFAVKAGASGDITLLAGAKSNDGVAWRLAQAGPPMASPLLYDGLLYILERQSLLTCYNAKTGKQVYKERLPGARGFTSSPWGYDGKVFCLADDGQTFVVQAGPNFKLLGKNPVGEMCWSSPAIAAGALFLRGVDHLYCIKQ